MRFTLYTCTSNAANPTNHYHKKNVSHSEYWTSLSVIITDGFHYQFYGKWKRKMEKKWSARPMSFTNCMIYFNMEFPIAKMNGIWSNESVGCKPYKSIDVWNKSIVKIIPAAIFSLCCQHNSKMIAFCGRYSTTS